MTHSQPLALIHDWHVWDGRIVNGKYRLRQFLADQAGIAVYLTDVNGSTAVIKLLAADATQASAQVASWKLAAQLSHPNLVRVFETGLWHADDEHDLQFAVMENCEESLDAVLRQRPLTPGEVRQMLTPALDALKYLQQHSVVHGQLNPANILASGDQLKLSTDHLRRCTETDRALFSGPYDAPERAAGTISLSSDIWSLGMTLHETLTRRLPTLNKDGGLEISEKIPSPFDEVVKQCLTPERQSRPSIAAIASLLEKPVPVLIINREAPATPNPGVPLADTRIVQPEPSTSTSTLGRFEESGRAWPNMVEKRPVLIAVAALIVLFAVLLGVRYSGRTKEVPSFAPSGAISQQATASATRTPAIVHSGSEASANASGSVLQQVMPDISSHARSTIHGTVKVRIKVAVTAEGKVSRAELAARGPSQYFSRQALEAARQWTFAPPRLNGKAEPSAWILRFEFRGSGTRVGAQRV
jgi:TonB family protein